MNPLLDVKHLKIQVPNPNGLSALVDGVDFSVDSGEIVGIMGASGCGKSLTASGILQLLPKSYKVTGKVYFDGHDLTTLTQSQLTSIRGKQISLILQDPSSALNPLMPLGKQLIEGLMFHCRISKKEAYFKGIEWLNRVGIDHASTRMKQYPHEISGGMKQRVLIAMALICQPKLLIADEPTTALDVTIQIQILNLILKLQKEEKISILLITHDIGVIAKCCQKVIVMFEGRMIERGLVSEVFSHPQHPYTKSLLNSRHQLESCV